MKLTRLRLIGFKSFVEPTEILIEPGLTGVVGPNGCGKSNLLEELRWATGETPYKSMRRSAVEAPAPGARSPALVRQGRIGEIVNAAPQERRRVLEDAAGIAGLHSRRHEAELRLDATEANLSRLRDLVGAIKFQIQATRRQARQAPRYREIS